MFDQLADHASTFTGHPLTFAGFVVVVVAWSAIGPLVGFTNSWQLVINTSTTILTTGLVLLIQHSQNRDTAQLKDAIGELVHATPRADDAKAPS